MGAQWMSKASSCNFDGVSVRSGGWSFPLQPKCSKVSGSY
jgi:hypothetical protein